jgi:phosphatidylinositol glycan class B
MLRSPFVLPVLFFIIGHCLVGHKEERFLFPILNVLPLFIGWGLPGLIQYWQTSKKWVKYLIKGSLVFSVCLNVFLLVALVFTPYSQAIHFTYLLKKKFDARPVTIYCINQSPFETENGLQLVFYRKAIKNIELKKIHGIDSLLVLKDKEMYVSTTYNHTTDEEKLVLDRLGYKPVAYASKFLWDINGFLHTQNINTINDIWVLYKRE